MPLMSIHSIGWMSSLAKDALLQTFVTDFYELETSTDDYLTELGDKYAPENSATGEGILLKSDGGRLLLST